MKTEVSKSSEVGVLIVGIDTMRAPRADPALTPFPPAVAFIALNDLEDDERNPSLRDVKTGFRVLDEEVAGIERAGEKDAEAAAAIRDHQRDEEAGTNRQLERR